MCVCYKTVAASDVGRALLMFGAGYPLGERGLDWLKIHLVNLHGHKKKWFSLSLSLAWCSVYSVISQVWPSGHKVLVECMQEWY